MKTTEIFFYADDTLTNPLKNPFKEPLVIYPRGEMNSVIVDEDKIKDLMNANSGVTFWPTNVGGVSPEKPKNWIDQELWKWHTDMVKGGVEYADAERGKVKLVADSPAREIEAPEHDEFNSEGLLPNEIPGMMTSKGELISHGLGILGASQKFQVEVIEIPERAVVGYEEPKPIDTIEKKHELRIKNLEARVKQLEDQLFKYFGSKNG